MASMSNGAFAASVDGLRGVVGATPLPKKIGGAQPEGAPYILAMRLRVGQWTARLPAPSCCSMVFGGDPTQSLEK
jgi:hypothetical protein